MPQRPMPDDFAEHAGKSLIAITKHYGCASGTALRWRRELGGEPKKAAPPQRAMPEGFAGHAHKPNSVLIKQFKATGATVSRWRRECGLNLATPHQPKPLPEDFAERAPSMTVHEIRAKWGISEWLAYRWCHRAGVWPRKAEQGERTTTRLDRRASRSTKHFSPQNKPHLDMTRAGRAAEYLRRYGPVVRCNVGGRYDPNGDHWRRGSAILNAQEVVERAIRNGWDENGWRRVAA